jgi:Fe-Mn family superoxide dismutase
MYALPDLPYAYDALQPTVSDKTLHFHHDKHHAGYVTKLNAMAKEAGLDGKPLEEVVRAAKSQGLKPLFNNAAQAWNHAFFWESMRAAQAEDGGGGVPGGDFAAAIASAFGGQDQLKDAFVKEGVGHFASGWVWLVSEGGALKVISTHDADDTLPQDGVTPLLVCDLWEHAYYLDHQNDREAFLKAWFDNLANWAFAEVQFKAAAGNGQAYVYPAPTAA